MHLLFVKNVRDIQRRPLRTVLTVLGVLLGVAGIVAISYTGRNLAAAQQQTYAGTRQPDITAFASQLPPTLLDLIGKQDNVAVVDSQAVQFTRATNGGGWVSTQLVGINDFANQPLDEIQLVSGHFPGRGEVAFDASSTKLLSVHLGDLVALQPTAGADITYAHVSGFVRVPAALSSSLLNQVTAFMPARSVRDILGARYDNYLLVHVNQPQRASETANKIQEFLSQRGISSSNYTVKDPNRFTGSRELGTLLLLLQVFSIIGAVLSSFLVANTIAAVMVEETRQIGVIKALGGTRWSAMRPYLTFALMIGISGAVLGWLAGLAFGRVLTGFIGGLAGLSLPPFTLSARELGLALLVGVCVTIGSAVIPAWLASKQRVARLLANLGVVADFRRGLTQRVTSHASRLGTVVAMGIRNVFRRPARAWMTLVVVAIAVAAFLSTQAVNRSVNITVDHLYALYGADAYIFFNRQLDLNFAQTLETSPQIVHAEPWLSSPGSIGSVTTDVWGVPSNTTIYKPQVVAGTWVRQANPIGAVLTDNLARAINANVGELVTVDVNKRSTLVQVVGIVNDEATYLGATATGKVFLNDPDAEQVMNQGTGTSFFALKLHSSEPRAVDQSLSQIEQEFKQYGPTTLPTYQDEASSKRVISILTTMLDAMVVIVSVVGLFGIVNTLLINLTERRREYGILRAVGASGRQLVRLVMAEAVALTFVGCAVGTAIGYPLARFLVVLTGARLFRLEFHLGAPTMLMTFVVAIGAAAAVSTAPGLIASRLRPIQVLRYE